MTPLPTGGCGAKDIYDALLNAGFSTVQAVGALANGIAESGLNPETRVTDSNGAKSNGIWQFNEATYGDSGKLITGDCAVDLVQQVGYLKSHISGGALTGSTGAEVAGNFAANFERCKGCQSGDTTTPNGWGKRVANAAIVEGWIKSGKWPAGGAGIPAGGGGGGSAGEGSGGGVLTPPAGLTSAQAAACVMPLNVPLLGSFCLLTKSQARGLIGGLLMIGGGLLVLPGLLVLAAAGLGQTGAGRAAGQAAEVIPTVRVARAATRARPSRARSTTGSSTPASSPAPAAAPRRAPVTRAAPAPRSAGTRADARGTSPEFRRQFLGES